MENIILLFILIPLLGALTLLFIDGKKEVSLSWIAILSVGLHGLLFMTFGLHWLWSQQPPLAYHCLSLYQTKDFNFNLDFYFDSISLVYMSVSSLLVFLVTIFSKYYLHRDAGFKRLFLTLLFFYFGLNIIVFSGNFETIFVGWEILGITSFLLIAFYRDRYLPVKNGLKVISVYRLGDISLLIGIWLSHHLLHENIDFVKMAQPNWLEPMLGHHATWGVIVSFMFLIAAAVKSAQLPFSSWLPRAMEGPTTSSAIFYGSLSVHLGVFLLLRTYPFWSHFLIIRCSVVLLGVMTALIASSIARVQSTVKTQIAYSSIVQIGLMFIEVALGWHFIALFHFAGNAFLRTYELLVSPSVLSYLIHEQFYAAVPVVTKVKNPFLRKCLHTFYVLSVKEWNLDFFQYRYLWTPFKWIGKRLDFLNNKIFIFLFGLAFVLGLVFLKYDGNHTSTGFKILILSYGIIGMLLIIKALSERKDAKRAWSMVCVSQLFIALTISLNEHIALSQIIIFMSGVLICGLLGFWVLLRMEGLEKSVHLDRFQGHIYEHPKYAITFLIACLGISGFPFTPTFLGIDLIFSHIQPNDFQLIIFASISFIFIELSTLRIYARLFLGPHIKTYHEIAYKSS